MAAVAKIWKGMSLEQWREENEQNWNKFIEGKVSLQLPEGFFKMDLDGPDIAILVQPHCHPSSAPEGPFVRTSFYGGALKVFVPPTVKVGDYIRVVRKSKSGKSLIAIKV
jgi:hypothetical protein